MSGGDWHNDPHHNEWPKVTRHDCGETVVITTQHADGSESVGIINRDAYGLAPMRKGE